jgi:hypothetical protein
VIDDKIRKNTLAFELARLDELQQVFCARALNGDLQCAAGRIARDGDGLRRARRQPFGSSSRGTKAWAAHSMK